MEWQPCKDLCPSTRNMLGCVLLHAEKELSFLVGWGVQSDDLKIRLSWASPLIPQEWVSLMSDRISTLESKQERFQPYQKKRSLLLKVPGWGCSQIAQWWGVGRAGLLWEPWGEKPRGGCGRNPGASGLVMSESCWVWTWKKLKSQGMQTPSRSFEKQRDRGSWVPPKGTQPQALIFAPRDTIQPSDL